MDIGHFIGATVTGFLPLPFAVHWELPYTVCLFYYYSSCTENEIYCDCNFDFLAISCLFYWTPVLNQLSNGWVIIICAVVASAFGAWKFPIKEDKES